MLIDTHRRRKRREKGREREGEKGVGPGDMRGLVIFSGGGGGETSSMNFSPWNSSLQ